MYFFVVSGMCGFCECFVFMFVLGSVLELLCMMGFGVGGCG